MRKRTIVLILLIPLTILQSVFSIFMGILVVQLYIQNNGQIWVTDRGDSIDFSAYQYGYSIPKFPLYFGFISLVILVISLVLLARSFLGYRRKKQKIHESYTV